MPAPELPLPPRLVMPPVLSSRAAVSRPHLSLFLPLSFTSSLCIVPEMPLSGIASGWLNGWMYPRSSCMPIVPGRSRRDCVGYRGVEARWGAWGWGVGEPSSWKSTSSSSAQGLLPSHVQLLEDWTHRIKIRPMQWHVIMMPPCHCIEIFHKGLNIMSAIEHTMG